MGVEYRCTTRNMYGKSLICTNVLWSQFFGDWYIRLHYREERERKDEKIITTVI